ncbi:hypothetical protein GCM10025865_21140 [Paraoerskovia sediminicola]|uniref:Uncharacterized protein n=1 Tax=Paraoerskovia sediminicola TaxID=1138587 RepID=A0ABN6XDI0_9CELL|nr:hypothetical protein [Paraoerskovia sediminicola]BDZ42815.1 hypothetical protein GCM10025865_21140 [Paraoerskovia sediminicola]
MTPQRRERRIAALRSAGQEELARQAESMEHVMAPHVGGVLAAIESAPQARVVFVGHTGLEHMSTVRDVWRELPMDKHILVRARAVEPGDVPTDPAEREGWLFAEWMKVDAWIAERSRAEEMAAEREASEHETL